MAPANFHPVTRAACWMSGALLSLMAMAVATRELSAFLTISQILFFRGAFGVLVIGCLLWRTGWRQVVTPRLSIHFVRNLSQLAAQYGWIYGIIFIPMSEVFAIEFTAPVWTTLFAAVILKEKITYPRLLALLLGLAGTLLIVRPGIAVVHPAALAVLFGAVCFALTYTMTKKLARTDTPLCILFYMCMMQMPIALVPAVLDWRPVVSGAWPFILVIGAMGLVAHYAMARAMKIADATIVVPMDFLRLPLIAVVGAVLYGESVEAWVFIGAALILFGNLFSIQMEQRAEAAGVSRGA